MANINLEPGRFYAGVTIPFFIPNSMVVAKLESLGFTNITIHDRADSATLAINPRKDPKYSDSWEQWVEADYNGEAKPLEFERHWQWLMVAPWKKGEPIPAPNQAPVPVKDLQAPKDASPGLILLGLGVTLFGMLWRK